MPTIQTSDRLNLYYQEENPTGRVKMIFLHGLGANSKSWVLQSPYFAALGYHTIMPDMRGFGKSGYARGSFSFKHLAGDVDCLMKALSVKKAVIIGISMGGIIALQFALDFPDQVLGLVLTNSFAALRPKSLTSWLYFLHRMILVQLVGIEQQADLVASRVFPLHEQANLRKELRDQILQADRQAYRAAMRSFVYFDVRQRLAEITMPCLLISGGRDTTVPLSLQYELAQKIPKCDHIVVEGAGHAVSVDSPQQYNDVVAKFLQKNLIVPER
jgi:pimeloyl-ACP methyl ester carboxylesterase